MPPISPAPRFILYGLIAMAFYSSYRYYYSTSPIPNLALSPVEKGHTYGSSGPTSPLADGRMRISRRTIAVADLHGDLQHALNVLSMAGVVSTTPMSGASDSFSSSASGFSVAWTGGHDVLLSTGDIVDRGDDTIPLYQLFISLRTQASLAGGEVVNLLGNHEVMNGIGDWRYVTKGDIESFGGLMERRHAISDQGWIGRDWLENYNVTASVSLLPVSHPGLPKGYEPPKVSFVHGGITPEYASKGVDYINKVGTRFLLNGLSEQNPSSSLPGNTTEEEQHLWSEHGPLWYRGYATDAEPFACTTSQQARERLGVRHLVMGHTPHFDGFVTRCDTGILLIDTGISRAYGGEQSALLIDLDMEPVEGEEKDGKKLWRETETLTALYKARLPKVLARVEKELWL
ncbi:uncharacterized protein UHOD_05157 [Ustilago sp. UG-2017b]|nr:uncharacterized protein UHOD_05157 [Ustilago sp. UG-2017b]